MQTHLGYLSSTKAPAIESYIASSKNQQSQMCLFPQSKYSHRESEKCRGAVFSHLASSNAHPPETKYDYRQAESTVMAAFFPKRLSNYLQKKKKGELAKCYFHTLSLSKNIIINGRVNKFKTYEGSSLHFIRIYSVRR